MRARPAIHAARHAAAVILLALAACTGLQGPFIATDEAGEEAGVPIDLRLEGTRNVAAHRLLREIEDRLYDLSRSPDSLAIAEDLRFDVEDFYRQEGFPDVAVSTRVENVGNGDRRALVITVDEGPLVTVRRMQLDGAATYDRERLLEFWLQRGSGAFGLGRPLFVRNDIDGFVQSLEIFLRGEGFLDAEVSLAPVTRADSGEQVDLRVLIEQRERYEVGVAEIAPELETALEGVRIESPTGEPAAAQRLDQFRTAVFDSLRRRGRPEPRIRAVLSRRVTDDGHFVDIRIAGDPGRLARITAVDIVGLDDTDESVVRDRLEFAVGERYDGADVDETLRDLYLTGLFQRVDVQREWLEEEPDADGAHRLRLRLELTEQRSRTIEALVGWGSYEQARGKLRFEEANLFGTGRGLVVEGRVSQKGWRGLTTVTDPNAFGTGLRLSVSLDAMRREEPSFVDRAWGGTVALTEEVSDRWTARAGYTYRLHDGLTSDVIDPAASITRYIEGSPFIETRYDSRDSLIYPRDGWQLNAQLDANDPAFGADLEFVRFRLGASYYLPFSDDLSLALRAGTGLLWPGSDSDLVPLQERFYNGGENTVRSFREAEVGPLDINGNPTGGEFRSVFGAEFRGRLVKTLEAALFADAGNVGSSVADYGTSDMRYALGAGLRLALPIGPVRVDAAWNPDRRPDEREWTVHLSVGYPF